MIAFLFPFAPACANPLKVPSITMFSLATISAPPFTSPSTTILPSNSIFFPDLNDPFIYCVSEILTSFSNVFLMPCSAVKL